MNIREESLKKHYEWKGKIEVVSRASINTREELALAVKICLCLYGVDHAVSDDARLIHGDGDDRHIRLDQTVLLSRTGAGG